MNRLAFLGAAFAAVLSLTRPGQAADSLLNASYDVSRELFVKVNEEFVAGHPGVTIDH